MFKISTYGAIRASNLKQSVKFHLKYLTNIINDSLKESTFHDKLKQSEVTPVYKTFDPIQKKNYRPVSLLRYVRKVFERIIYKQVNSFMEKKVSKGVTSFRHMAHIL